MGDSEEDGNDDGEHATSTIAIAPDPIALAEATAQKVEQMDGPTSNIDPDIVDWDGPHDPKNPQNWRPAKKWANALIVTAMTFLIPFSSSVFAPGVSQVTEEFQNDNPTLASLVVSVFILGFAAGPLVVAPLSEMYGRLIVYHVTNVLFIVFTTACAVSSNFNMLIGFRFLAGFVGAAPMTIGAGTIYDVMPPERRGSAMGIYGMGPTMGPVLGPVIGGFLSQGKGWRWTFWLVAILSGAVTIVGFVFLRESYAPVLLNRKARALRSETGNVKLRSKFDQGLSPREIFVRAIVRPLKLLSRSLICCLMSFYCAFVYGIMYLLLTVFSLVFEQTYGFNTGESGLSYIGLGVGLGASTLAFNLTSDRIMIALARKHKHTGIKPEYRLVPCFFAGPSIVIGLFIFGWTAQYRVHWLVPIIGSLFVGLGVTPVISTVSTYMVDAFTIHTASAIAANTLLRSLFGAMFPLFAQQLYSNLGLGWGNSLLAFIGLLLCPIPFLFYTFGEKIRTNPRFQIEL